MLIVNTVRYVFLRSHCGHWAEMLLVLQVTYSQSQMCFMCVIKIGRIPHFLRASASAYREY